MPKALDALRIIRIRIVLDLMMQRAQRNHAVMSAREPAAVDTPGHMMDGRSASAHKAPLGDDAVEVRAI